MEEKIEREKPHAHLTFLSLFSLFHSFVFFVETKSNILPKIKGKKKEREGKNYKPAKPGDPDRPDPEALKKAQSS